MSDILTSWSNATVSYLLAGSVTAAVLVPLAWAITRIARIRTPVYRYIIWLYSLIGIVMLPMVWLYGPKLTLPVLPGRVESTEVVTLPQISLVDAIAPVRSTPYPEPSHTEIVPAAKAERQDLHLKTVLAWAWFVGFIFMVARLGIGWYRLRRFYLMATPVPSSECPVNLTRYRLRVMLTSQLQGPVCFGVFRPVILLPQDMYHNGTAENLRMVLTHELAHIERRDCWANLFQRIVEAAFFFHPLVWLASRQVTQQREQICDNHVLAQGVSPDDYTTVLSQMGEQALRTRCLQTVALFEGQLLSRIRSLLDPLRNHQTKLPWRVALTCTVAVLVAFLAFGSVRLAARPSDSNTDSASKAVDSASTLKEKSTGSLHEAARDGDIEQVKALIAAGTDINAKDEQDRTPLHRAATLGHKATVEYLLAQGADVNEAAPLHRAAAYGHKDVVEILLDNGANVNAFENGWTPLHYAALYGYTELLALLIDNGADVNTRMKSEQWKGWTTLHLAGRFGSSIDVVEHLIDNGADTNSRDDKGNTPLHTATSWARRSEVIELLLNKGADVNARNNMGQTPLHVGPLRDIPLDVKKVQILMARGADVSAKDKNGRTPLHHAAANGFVEIVQSMITAGADVNAKTNDGIAPIDEALRIPGTIQPRLGVRCRQLDVADLLLANGADSSDMHVAAYAGNLGRVKELVERGISVNAKHASNLMPLHTAASGGHKEVVAFLIAKGADVKAEGYGDRTPLHYAGIAGHSEVAELLIAHGAEVNVVKKEGDRTILHDAVFYSHTDVAKVLLDNGADVNKRDSPNGRAPLHSAMDGGSIEMVKLLIARGADVNADAQYGATPLHRATIYGHKDIAELLIAHGADVNARGKRLGNTPLDSAVRFNKKEMVELLLAKGADPNAKDENGRTPLSHAKRKDYAEIAELLRRHGAKE